MPEKWADYTVAEIEDINRPLTGAHTLKVGDQINYNPNTGEATISTPMPPKPSKYRNRITIVDGERFDSKREAQYWAELKLREKAGEIKQLSRQIPFELCCPTGPDESEVVCQYIADFGYKDRDGTNHIVDVKGGKETAMFALKRKWLFLQSGIEVEIVR